MRLPLFVTCPVDLVRPSIAFAGLRVFERAGREVVAPPGWTACGQPAWKAGNRGIAPTWPGVLVQGAVRFLRRRADDGGCIGVFAPASRWAGGSDLPAPPGRTFHELNATRKRV
jgi:Fe-S oxidoreductase